MTMNETFAAKAVYVDPSVSYAVGVDIGGTKINAGIIRRDGEVLLTYSLPTLAGKADVMDRIREAVATLLSMLRERHPDLPLKGIGVGTAGQVEWTSGSIRFASDLIPGYAGTPIRAHLEERFGLPVYVDNDVNVLALTEKYLGAGQGARHLLCLALGTGVGGAVMIDGRIVHGAWGGAGEMGHFSVQFNGRPCICGGVGCLEQYASGTSIAQIMKERLAERGLDGAAITAKDVIARWLSGDDAAAAVMDEVFAALGAGIASLIHIFNPEVIVIGGGVAEVGEPLFARLRSEVDRRAMASMAAQVRIEPAYKGNWSGMIGAALQVWEYEAAEV